MAYGLVNTSPLSDSDLRRVVRWCAPAGVLRRLRQVRANTTGLNFHGHCTGTTIHLGIPPVRRFKKPFEFGGFRGYLKYRAFSWAEELVCLTAHELRHVYQFGAKGSWGAPATLYRETRKVRRKNLGTSAKLIEVDASLFAIRTMRRYRREGPALLTLPR